MRRLTIFMAAASGAALLAAAPAAAERPFGPDSFDDLAEVFNSADLNRDGDLSSRAFYLLRTGMVDRNWLGAYRGADDRAVPTIVRGFSRLDRDDDGIVSRTEFMNLASDPVRERAVMGNEDRWDWRPEYVTMTYYLTANPIDGDAFDGQPVVNLEGEALGTVRDVARHEETGEYYALVGVAGRVMDPTPTPNRARLIGVPLDDILLARQGESLMLSHRGERHLLTDGGMPKVDIDELEEVETLYGV